MISLRDVPIHTRGRGAFRFAHVLLCNSEGATIICLLSGAPSKGFGFGPQDEINSEAFHAGKSIYPECRSH